MANANFIMLLCCVWACVLLPYGVAFRESADDVLPQCRHLGTVSPALPRTPKADHGADELEGSVTSYNVAPAFDVRVQ